MIKHLKLGMLLAAALVVSAAAAALAQTRPDFGGAWVMDKAKTEGLPPDMEQEMTVEQSGDSIKLSTKLTTQKGQQEVADAYLLDGKEHEFSPQGPGGARGKGSRTAKWTDDGLEVSERVVFDGEEGPVTVELQRKWTLGAGGKTLIIMMAQKGPQGSHQTSRTFNRK